MALRAYSAYEGDAEMPNGRRVSVFFLDRDALVREFGKQPPIGHPAYKDRRRVGWYWRGECDHPDGGTLTVGPFTSSRKAIMDALWRAAPHPWRPIMCGKRRVADEFYCTRCRTRWDVTDTEPPPCEAEQARPVTLTERLRVLSTRLRDVSKDAPVPRSIMDDLDDMIEEVKLLDDDRRRAKANAKGGSGGNVTPLRRG